MAETRKPNLGGKKPEEPIPLIHDPATPELREIKVKFEQSKANLEQLAREFQALAEAERMRLQTLGVAIEKQIHDLEGQELDFVEKADVEIARTLTAEIDELINNYQVEVRWLGLQKEYQGVKGAEFLDKEAILRSYDKELEALVASWVGRESIETDLIPEEKMKELRENLNLSEKELKEILALAQGLTVENIKAEDQAKSREERLKLTGKERLGKFLSQAAKRVGTNIGAAMAVSSAVGFVGLTGGIGLAAAAGGMTAWRYGARLVGNKWTDHRYRQQVDNVLAGEGGADKDHTVALYKDNLANLLQANQFESLRKKKEGEKTDLNKLRADYIEGRKSKDEFRQEIAKLKSDCEANEQSSDASAEDKEKARQVYAAVQSLFMMETSLDAEKSLYDKKKEGDEKKKITKGKVLKEGWYAVETTGYGLASRLVSYLPYGRFAAAAAAGFGGWKLGALAYEAQTEGKDESKSKNKEYLYAAIGAGAMGALAYFSDSRTEEERQKEFHDLLESFGVGSEPGKVETALGSTESGGPPALGRSEESNMPPAGSVLGGEGRATEWVPGQQGSGANIRETGAPSAEGRTLPETSDKSAVPSYAASLEKLGFGKHEGKLLFDLAEKAQTDPNLGHLEQVFDRVVAAKYLDEFGKDHNLDATEAAKILNMSANLVKMAEAGHHDFTEAASYDAEHHTLTIVDEAKFANLVDKLKAHADELAKANKLGGAEEYIDNIRTKTWQEIVQSQETKIAVPEFPRHEHAAAPVSESPAVQEQGDDHVVVGPETVETTRPAPSQSVVDTTGQTATSEPGDKELKKEPTGAYEAPPAPAAAETHGKSLLEEEAAAANPALLHLYRQYGGAPDAYGVTKEAHEDALKDLAHYTPEQLSQYREFSPQIIEDVYKHKLASELERGFMGLGGPRSEVLMASTRELSRVAGLPEGQDGLFGHWLSGPDGVLKKDDLKPLWQNHEINLDAVKGKISEFTNLAQAKTVPAGSGWEPRHIFLSVEGQTQEWLANIKCANPHANGEARIFELDRDGDGKPEMRFEGQSKLVALFTRPEAKMEQAPYHPPEPITKQETEAPKAKFVERPAVREPVSPPPSELAGPKPPEPVVTAPETVDPVDLSLRTMVAEGAERDRITTFIHESSSRFEHGHDYTGDDPAGPKPEEWPQFMRFKVRETLLNYLEKPSNQALEDLRIITTPELVDKEIAVGVGDALKDGFKGKDAEILKAIQALVEKSVDASRQVSQGVGISTMGQ